MTRKAILTIDQQNQTVKATLDGMQVGYIRQYTTENRHSVVSESKVELFDTLTLSNGVEQFTLKIEHI